MPDDLRVNRWLVIPSGELRERFSRSSGPGGQSVNTTDSRVELSFDVLRSPSLPERERERALARLGTRLADGVVTVAAENERSQLMNREAARARMAALLREAVAPPPPPRVPTKPTRGARERRLADKRPRAPPRAASASPAQLPNQPAHFARDLLWCRQQREMVARQLPHWPAECPCRG